MKTGEVARMMMVNPKTITNWTEQEELKVYFSSSAKSDGNATQRDYTPDDVLIINTIRLHKTRQNGWGDVGALLEQGFRETELPLGAAITKTISPVDQVSTLMKIRGERDTALAQYHDAVSEIERLRDVVEEERTRGEKAVLDERERTAKAIAEERERTAAQLKEANQTLNDLNKYAGKLEGQVQSLQEQLNKYEDKK